MGRSESTGGFSDHDGIAAVLLWVGSLMLIVSVFLGWLVTPLQGKIKAYAFPFMKSTPLTIGLNNPFQLGSFGVVLFAFGILAITFIIVRAHPRLLFHLGGAAAIVCLSFIGNMLFLHSEMLESWLDQNVQVRNIGGFSDTYLNGNAQALKADEGLTTDTILGKVQVGMGALGGGWYVTVLGTLLILIGSYQKMASRSKRWDAVGLTLILLVATASLSARTLKAEYDRVHGDRYLAQGEVEKSFDLYEAALRWDPDLKNNSRYVYNVGAVCYRLGLHRAETHLYLGDNYMTVGNFLEAAREYEVASTLSPDLSVANRRRVDALVRLGLRNYSKRLTYLALSNWRESLRLDPNQVQSHFFLAKALSDIDARDQSKSIAEAGMVLGKTREKLVRSDIYNLLGNSYYKQRDFVTAREMYNLSKAEFRLVKIVINFNAMKGLQGI